jgi:hypothetical protein
MRRRGRRVQQKTLARFHEIGDKKCDDEMFVDLTIYNVSASLLREFAQKIISPCYPGGVSEAIKDLMRKAILNYDINQKEVTGTSCAAKAKDC